MRTLKQKNSDIVVSSSKTLKFLLQIQDGVTENAPVLSRLCGTTMPEGSITTSTNQMRLTFVTDGSVSNHGFRASYISEDSHAEIGRLDEI